MDFNPEALRNSLNDISTQISSSSEMVEQVTFLMFGAVVTTTRAFDKVKIKVDSATNRVFIAVDLKWWANSKKLEKLHKIWIKRAEERCKEVAPDNWKVLVYFNRGNR